MVSGLDGGVSAGPVRGMRSRTWRRSHTYSSIRDAHRAAARGPPLGAGFQPRGEGNGADRSHAGDRREGARTDAALRQRCRPRAVSHHYRRERLEVRRLLRLPYRGSVPVPPPTVGLNEDGPLRRPLPGRLESHDADARLDRRDRPRETRWDRTRERLCRRRPRVRSLTERRGWMVWRSMQVAVAVVVLRPASA